MSALASPRILSGAAATKAAEKLRLANDRKGAWPYPYLEAPPDSVPVNAIGVGAIPLANASVTVLSFLVPATFKFVLQGIWESFSGAFLPGDSFWTVFVNPNNGVQAYPVQGLSNISVPLGNWQAGIQFWFPRPYEFSGLDLITSVATNVNLASPSTNAYVSGFFGFLIPQV